MADTTINTLSGDRACPFCGASIPAGGGHLCDGRGAKGHMVCSLCGSSFPVGSSHDCPSSPATTATAPGGSEAPTVRCPHCGTSFPIGTSHDCPIAHTTYLVQQTWGDTRPSLADLDRARRRLEEALRLLQPISPLTYTPVPLTDPAKE